MIRMRRSGEKIVIDYDTHDRKMIFTFYNLYVRLFYNKQENLKLREHQLSIQNESRGNDLIVDDLDNEIKKYKTFECVAKKQVTI